MHRCGPSLQDTHAFRVAVYSAHHNSMPDGEGWTRLWPTMRATKAGTNNRLAHGGGCSARSGRSKTFQSHIQHCTPPPPTHTCPRKAINQQAGHTKTLDQLHYMPTTQATNQIPSRLPTTGFPPVAAIDRCVDLLEVRGGGGIACRLHPQSAPPPTTSIPRKSEKNELGRTLISGPV